MEEYHQLQLEGIRSRNGYFSEELCGENVINFRYAIMSRFAEEQELAMDI